MAKKYPFDRVETLVAATGTNDVVFRPSPPGSLFCVQWITVENETHTITDVRIIKRWGSTEMPLLEKDSLGSATIYWSTDPIYLSERQELVARFTGCTANDRLRVYLSGWFQRGLMIQDS